MNYRPIIISSHLVHQLSSWYILTCILDIYLDTISLNNYNQIDYALDLSPLNLTCCSQGQSRNKKLALSQSTRSPSGFHYFAKSPIFAKYIGHRGLCVCVSVCLFVCLSVCPSSKALQAAPLVRSSWFLLQKMSSGHATMQNFFFWQSDEGQGQGHHFCENQIMAITFEPEVTETSGWLQNVPYIIPLLSRYPPFWRTPARF